MPGPAANSKLVNRPATPTAVKPAQQRARTAEQRKRTANAPTPALDAGKLPPSLRAFTAERPPATPNADPGKKSAGAPPTAPGKAPVKEPPKQAAKEPPKAPPEAAAKSPAAVIPPLPIAAAAAPKLPAPAAPAAAAKSAAPSAAPAAAPPAAAARSATPAPAPAARAASAPAPAAAAPVRNAPTAAPASANEEGSEAAAETPVANVAAGESQRAEAAPAAAPAEHAEDAPAGEAAPAPEAAGEAPAALASTPGAAPAAAGPSAAPATDSMTRIARARPGAVQAEALVQAGLITQDSVVNEQQINRLADTRRMQVDMLLATVQQTVIVFFMNLGAQVQSRILAFQALLMTGMMTILSLLTARILGTIATAQMWLNRAHRNLSNRINQISTTLQSGVSAITGRISGFVSSLPLPDLPGVERVRGIATSLLGGGARLINRALSNTTRGMLVLIGIGAGLLNNLLTGFSIVMTTLLGIVTRTLAQLMQAMFQAFNACITTIGSVLMSLLQRTLAPLLARVGRIAHRWIGYLQQRALRSLRETRQQAIDAIAESVAPGTPAGAGAGDPPASDAERIAMLRLLRFRALAQGMLIVRLAMLLGGEAIGMMIALVQTAAVRIISGIRSLIDGVIATVATVVTQVMGMLGSIVRYVHHAITLLSEFLQRAFVDQVEALARFLLTPVSNLLIFAANAGRRLMSAASELVSRFIRAITGASVDDASTLVGTYAPAQIGPITPLRGPIVIPEPGTIERIIRVAAPLVVAAVKALVKVLGPKGALLVIVIVLLVIALLLLYLLWLLLKWIYETFIKPKPKPTKRVIKVDPLRLELGVGGRDLDTTATLAPGTPPVPPLTWTVSPGGTPPVGVSVIGAGPTVQLRSAHPPHNTVLGGTSFSVRAALTSNPSDFADSGAITLIQILSATYAANPPMANVPSLIPGIFPPNTGEPNRDGIAGNTVVVAVTSAPAPRGARIEFRTPLDATASALTVTPGTQTGDLQLNIMDDATGAVLDPTLPSTAGGAAMMADLAINAVPTGVGSLTNAGGIGPYGVQNTVGFTPSDTQHAPLTRVVGELITDGGDQLLLTPVNGGFNNTFSLALAVPANQWTDQLWTPFNWPHRVDGRDAIDVNRFVGPGVPQLPRAVVYRQRFQYSAWHGAGTVISSTIADGKHIRTLIGTAPNFQFRTEHVFGTVAANPFVEAYAGNPLIVYSSPVITLNAPGATALADDGLSTGDLGVSTTVAGRNASWTVRSGDVSFVTANPIIPPARSRVRAGTTPGNAIVRISDDMYPNRQLDVSLNVAAVALNAMMAADPVVPSGQMSTTVSLDAQPGGRLVDWSVDLASFVRGVRVSPASTGPAAPPMNVTVTKPIGFSGLVTVIATDRATNRTSRCQIDFQ